MHILNEMTEEDIRTVEKKEIIFYVKLLIIMESKKYLNVTQLILEDKLKIYSQYIVKITYFYYSKINTGWFNKMSIFGMLLNPLWGSRKIYNYLKYKVMKHG